MPHQGVVVHETVVVLKGHNLLKIFLVRGILFKGALTLTWGGDSLVLVHQSKLLNRAYA